MVIKKPDKHSSYFWIFTSRKQIIRVLWSLCVLLGLAIFFIGSLGLGAYQNKTVVDSFYRPPLYKIAHLDFSNPGAIINGKWNDFNQLQINLNPEDFLKIQAASKKLASGLDKEPIMSEDFTAELNYKDKLHKIRIRLKSTYVSHLKDTVGYFRVETMGNDTVEGMILFHLFLPLSGEFISNWLAMDLMKERKVESLMGTFVNVSFNGKPYSIFYLEECYDVGLPNYKGTKDGIYFKIKDNELVFYNRFDSIFKQDQNVQMTILRQKWQNVIEGNLPLGKFIDLKKTGKLIAHLDLANQQNPFLNEMVLFYLDQDEDLAKPIAMNLSHIQKSPSTSMELFIESLKRKDKRNLWLSTDSWIPMIHRNIDFQQSYISEGEFISQKNVIDQLLFRNGDQLTYLLRNNYQDWPANVLPPVTLYAKAKYMRSILFPDVKEITAHLNQKFNDHLEIHLQSHSQLPLEIKSVSWRDSIFFYPNKAILLFTDNLEKNMTSSLFKFQFPDNFNWSDTLASELMVNYDTPGLQSGNKSVLIFPWTVETSKTQFYNPAVRNANYMTFDFLEKSNEEQTITIPYGDWSFSGDLVIPKNKRLFIEAGTHIDLINHAKIISYSPIICLGQKENPVVFKSTDSTGQGLIVVGANQESKFSYTNFDQLSNPKDNGWHLTGSVTFYESPVTIQHCRFKGNLSGDDYLNIVRTNFSMDQIVFENVIADAFDCDYCEGTIKNASFTNIGNDGVDVSGTVVKISNVFMDHIGDKGLSAGEDSELKADRIQIQNSEIGVTSKDRSKLFLSDSKLINVKVALTLFEKKSEFGPASMRADRVSIENSEIPFLVEQNSMLTVDGEILPPSRENVKELLYGAEFGKSSR